MARIWELPVDYTKLTQPQRREVRLQYIDNTWTSPTSGKRKCRTCQQMRYHKRYHGE